MATMSSREWVLLASTMVVLLFGGTAILGKKRTDLWASRKEEAQVLVGEIRKEKDLLKLQGTWESQYQGLKDYMPVFAEDKELGTHWLGIMDRVARKHKLSIIKRQLGKELEVGDVREQPIECKEWLGSLESVTKFLYDLQAENVMLDMRQMTLKKDKRSRGNLRGNFVLYSAYLRGEESKESVVVEDVTLEPPPNP